MTASNPTQKIKKGRTGFETGADILREHLRTMPTRPGVYRMLAADSTVLYVGKAKNLKNRVTSYTQRARLPNRLQRMVAQTRNLEIVVTHTESEALLLEANLIQRFMPPFNILLRDDKSYPYLLITGDHDFPQLLKHRGARTRKGEYFGPFANAGAVTETLNLLQRAFRLRNCNNSFFDARTRPCLQYHIKRCTAPCVGKVSSEDYAKQVQETRTFLKGHSLELQQALAKDMQEASDSLEFERAASLRDRIKLLSTIQSKQDIHLAGLGDADIIALHREGGRSAIQIFFFRADRNYGSRTCYPSHDALVPSGEVMAAFLAQFYADKAEFPPLLLLSEEPTDQEVILEALSNKAGKKITIQVPRSDKKKRLIEHAMANARAALGRKMSEAAEQKKLLANVATVFHLHEEPERIEVYDNSHTSGTYAVGAMIAAGAEGFLRKTYRKFNIKLAKGGDDFAMMREVLERRFKRLISEDPDRTSGLWPNLLLIDGGAGQIAKVQSVLDEMGIQDVALVGIAKGPDRNAGRERFFRTGHPPITLPPEDPTLYYLQRLRDEAHRFAIGTHRARRVKAIGISGLEDIAGIGASRKRALLHAFGSGKAVAGAGIDALRRVPGISPALAKKIYDYFHGDV